MTAIDQILKMDNPIQTYAWGSHTDIPRLMGGKCPSEEPQAEVWMGAHPKAPSKVWFEDQWQRLHLLIAQYPQQMLGRRVASHFDNTLPYLFKILAAGEPLSIQAHPDKQQAVDGFRKEDLAGIDLAAPHRNYKDTNHKPECMCAITPFWGLCGFRPPEDMASVMDPVWPAAYAHLTAKLTGSINPEGFRSVFHFLMGMEKANQADLVARVVVNADPLRNLRQAYDWVVKLNERYPGDIGVLAPLLLNVIALAPGEAIFLPARQLHAYLDGLGVELMANSDNVLRGGLTPKHIDVDELMAILDFSSHTPDKLTGREAGQGERVYDSPADEFSLAGLVTTKTRPYATGRRNDGPEILLCLSGAASIRKTSADEGLELRPGHSVFIPSMVEGYEIEGDARLFRAGVNI